MKYVYALSILGLLLCLACKEENKEENNEISITTQVEAEPSYTPPFPVVNFSEFESEYLNSTSDSTYVINFWATWCKPCVKELPAFEKIHATYATNKVKVILVSLDFPEHIEKAVVPFIEKQNLQSDIVLLDDTKANEWIPKVSEEWTGAIPATVILKGTKQKFYERSFTYEELETEIKSI